MNRPTIVDLAKAAGVSVSTVNRILGGSASVAPRHHPARPGCGRRDRIYGVGVIEARKKDAMPHYRLGFLLQQSTRDLYQLFAQKIRARRPASGATRTSSRLSSSWDGLNRNISLRG